MLIAVERVSGFSEYPLSSCLAQGSPMRRKYASPASPLLYFKDDILSVPGYTFERVISHLASDAWPDGSPSSTGCPVG